MSEIEWVTIAEFTAAELARKTEAATKVWRAWGKKCVDIVSVDGNQPVLAVRLTSDPLRVRVRYQGGWALEWWNKAYIVRQRPTPKPTYAALEAALARIDAVLATLPTEAPTMEHGSAVYYDTLPRYEVAQAIRAARKGE